MKITLQQTIINSTGTEIKCMQKCLKKTLPYSPREGELIKVGRQELKIIEVVWDNTFSEMTIRLKDTMLPLGQAADLYCAMVSGGWELVSSK